MKAKPSVQTVLFLVCLIFLSSFVVSCLNLRSALVQVGTGISGRESDKEGRTSTQQPSYADPYGYNDPYDYDNPYNY